MGRRIRPLEKLLSIRMVGDSAKAPKIKPAGTKIIKVVAKPGPNGKAARRTIGPDMESASRTERDGESRSSKIGLDTFIDYALGMHLDVLIIAEPGFEPSYAKPGDAGADLRSTETLTLEPGARALVKTGVKIAMPDGYVGLVHPRSGLAAKHGITVLNTPGTVDAGYRGELMVTLINTSDQAFDVVRGDRIAQLLFQKVERATFHPVTELPESARGDSGFGSSGRR